EATVRNRRLQVRSDAWAYAAASHAWLKLGAADRALERAQTACRVDPSNAAWAGQRGAVLEAKGDRLGAVGASTAGVGAGPVGRGGGVYGGHRAGAVGAALAPEPGAGGAGGQDLRPRRRRPARGAPVAAAGSSGGAGPGARADRPGPGLERPDPSRRLAPQT